MTSDHDPSAESRVGAHTAADTSTVATPGRRVELTPVPAGFWLIVGGGVVAALGPLFGFLVGSMLGSTTDTGDLDAIYLWLFLGILLGGLGVGAILLGIRRILLDRRTTPAP